MADYLEKIRKEKRSLIDNFVSHIKPQFRYVLNNNQQLYDELPAGLTNEKLELEFFKATQEWERSIRKQGKDIEHNISTSVPNWDFNTSFQHYCKSVSDLSKASLSEYVIRRKVIIELLQKALEVKDDGRYNSEASVHSIICPMHYTSDEIDFSEMNLWIIDERLAYHTFLASDKKMKSLPVLESSNDNRMDIAIFDQAFGFSESDDPLNSITIVEFKKPNRNDFKDEEKDPIRQVLGYVKDIRSGKVMRANGRPMKNVDNTIFYCYVIADITDTLSEDAGYASLSPTADGEGFCGYNSTHNAYVEVISYDKLVRDAKKRNQILFDKLFEPKFSETLNVNRSE